MGAESAKGRRSERPKQAHPVLGAPGPWLGKPPVGFGRKGVLGYVLGHNARKSGALLLAAVHAAGEAAACCGIHRHVARA